ncbi:cupin domain-containing protein [Methylocella sp.]|uniref:cupin domain-containing protein n=1 Tax=Methylocella sp. TaxID=1978226 RepID=UPI0035B1703E
MIRAAAFVTLCALCTSPALAVEMVRLPDGAAAKYAPAPASLPKGTLLATIQGDPSKPGPFALRIKFPPHTVVAPHTHSADETLTIFSGVLRHEMGEKLDMAAGEKVGAGGFVYLPANMPHSVWTEDEPVELQVTGTGPFGLNYVNPADDPSKTH